MKRELVLRNRQRIRAIDWRLLRRIGLELLDEILPGGQFELGVHLVTASAMEKLNRNFLEHEGPTDVITFDYAFGVPPSGGQVMQKPIRGNLVGTRGKTTLAPRGAKERKARRRVRD